VPMLDIYFQALREVMGAEARLLGKVFRTHRGKLGENREALLQRFFSTYLPQRFGVGTGFALLGEDISTQQDVVVYDRLNNPVLFPESAAPLFPPSALAAVVEVKSTLTRTELKKTVAKSVAMKRGIRASLANHPAPPHVQALSCLFAFRVRSLPLPTLLDALAEEEEALGAPPLDRLDMVCILGKGLFLAARSSIRSPPTARCSQRMRRRHLSIGLHLRVSMSCLCSTRSCSITSWAVAKSALSSCPTSRPIWGWGAS
jgi:hypothetical protein